jgi:hypothetical protein
MSSANATNQSPRIKNKDEQNLSDIKKRWNDQPKSFIPYASHKSHRTAEANYKVSVEIDEGFLGIDDIEGLKTTLFPHQKPIVQAMMDAENNRKSVIAISGTTTETLNLTNSSCVLSEPVGSGKTIDILALILVQKFPKVYPSIETIEFYESKKKTPVSIVRKKYKNILHPTIIFAGVSVVDQWVNAVKEFTSLRYFAVYQVKDLQLLIEMMVSKKINDYDVIIVKNGKITRPIQFPSFVTVEVKNTKSVTYIYNIIANINNFCWARVVVDDFDTSLLPYNSGVISGVFTWYLSSTKKLMSTRKNRNIQFRTTEDMFMHSGISWGKVIENKILFECLNIRNKPEFIERTNNLPSPEFFAYVFKNKNDRYIGLMGVLDIEHASQIMEMLNGDAFETAAETAGIKSTSVADIFQKILGKEFKNYETSIKVIEFIDKNEDANTRLPYSDCDDPDDTYTKTNLLEYRKPIYNYPGLRGILTNTKEEYEEIYEKSGLAIQRVKSNIEEGCCPICYIELSDPDKNTVILKCCGVVVCSECCFETIFSDKKMIGKCSNCRTNLNILNIIYVNSSFNLESIIKDRIQDDFSESSISLEPSKPLRTKIDAMIDIIKGVVPEEQQSVDVKIFNLMKGRGKLPKNKIQKVLIFANFDETLKQIEKDLTERKIEFIRLCGGHSEITRISDNFRKSTKSCVMIINSTKHCSGLNLQSSSDLIFAHKILDKSVQSQVAGRIQRMGRLTQARIHFMLYTNEFESMKYKNDIRVL